MILYVAVHQRDIWKATSQQILLDQHLGYLLSLYLVVSLECSVVFIVWVLMLLGHWLQQTVTPF